MKVKNFFNYLLVSVFCFVFAFCFVGCKQDVGCKQEWWKDEKNITYVLTDERALTDDYKYTLPDEKICVFEYIYEESWVPPAQRKDYLPQVKVYYKGKLMDECTCYYYFFYKLIKNDEFETDYIIKPGTYTAQYKIYPDYQSAVEHKNEFGERVLKIIVHEAGTEI